MNRFIQTVHAALLLTALTFGVIMCLAAWDLHKRLAHADQVITDADRVAVVAGVALSEAQKTLTLERAAATDQIKATNDLLRSGTQAIGGFNLIVDDAGHMINDVDTDIGQQNHEILAIEGQAATNLADLDATEKQLSPGIAHFDDASATLAAALPDILTNINKSTAQTVVVATNVAGTTQELEMTAHDVRTFADRQLAPVRGTWNIVKGFLVSFAGPAAQVATAAK